MKLKIALSIIFIVTTLSATVQCMKRPLDDAQISPVKRVKYSEESLLIHYDTLYSLTQGQLKYQNQSNLLEAIQQRNQIRVIEALSQKPKHTFIDWCVAIQFWQGVKLILRYGNPTQPELRRSLEIAIRTENIPLMQDLLIKNAHLDMEIEADFQIKKILHKNADATNLLIRYGLTFAHAICMDLALDTIEAIIKITKPKQSNLERALQYTNEKNYHHISLLLIAIKGNY